MGGKGSMSGYLERVMVARRAPTDIVLDDNVFLCEDGSFHVFDSPPSRKRGGSPSYSPSIFNVNTLNRPTPFGPTLDDIEGATALHMFKLVSPLSTIASIASTPTPTPPPRLKRFNDPRRKRQVNKRDVVDLTPESPIRVIPETPAVDIPLSDYTRASLLGTFDPEFVLKNRTDRVHTYLMCKHERLRLRNLQDIIYCTACDSILGNENMYEQGCYKRSKLL